MKKLFLPFVLLALLGAGCAGSSTTSTPVADNTAPVVVPAEKTPEPPKPTTFEYKKDSSYTLTFPSSWNYVSSISDFGGYVGESGPPDFDVPGKVRTFGLGSDGMGSPMVPLFVIIQIDLKDKGHKSIPKEDVLLGQNATSLFYGGVVTEDGQEWSFLYDGSQKKYAAQMKDVAAIFASFKLK